MIEKISRILICLEKMFWKVSKVELIVSVVMEVKCKKISLETSSKTSQSQKGVAWVSEKEANLEVLIEVKTLNWRLIQFLIKLQREWVQEVRVFRTLFNRISFS